MNGAQKRHFGIAFGVANNILQAARKEQRVRDSEDEEFMIMVTQFTGLLVQNC